MDVLVVGSVSSCMNLVVSFREKAGLVLRALCHKELSSCVAFVYLGLLSPLPFQIGRASFVLAMECAEGFVALPLVALLPSYMAQRVAVLLQKTSLSVLLSSRIVLFGSSLEVLWQL